MNLNRLIRRKFFFLVQSGYSYRIAKERNLWSEHVFKKPPIVVAIQLDCHLEFVDLTIINGTNVLFKTSYDRIIVDNLLFEKSDFLKTLKIIYSLPNNSYSLSMQQCVKLLDLYAMIVFKAFFEGTMTGDGTLS